MFGIKLGFTLKDLVRFVWVFLVGGAAYIAVQGSDVPKDWKGFVIAVGAAGILAVKNFILKDGTTIKG